MTGSPPSTRAAPTGPVRFFAWIREEGQGTGFTKATVQQYRAVLIAAGLSASTVNLRLSPIRKLARELADNQQLDPTIASAIERVPGIEKRGTRVGNWLVKDQANQFLNAPNPGTLAGKRDRAMLALLLGCGLRRGELLGSMSSISNKGKGGGSSLTCWGRAIACVPSPCPPA